MVSNSADIFLMVSQPPVADETTLLAALATWSRLRQNA
jgi:hypothetical protein